MNTLLKLASLLILVFAIQTSLTSNAIASEPDAEMESLITQVCEHVTMCMKQELEESEEEMSPRMRSMIDVMTKQTCQSLREYSMFVEYSAVTEDDVKACYKAMADIDCGTLQEQKDIPACKVIEEKLEDA